VNCLCQVQDKATFWTEAWTLQRSEKHRLSKVRFGEILPRPFLETSGCQFNPDWLGLCTCLAQKLRTNLN